MAEKPTYEELEKRIEQLEKSLKSLRKKESEHSESEKKYYSIIQSLPLGMHIYQIDPYGKLRFIEANPAAEKILKVDHKPYMGKIIYDAFPEISKTEIPERFLSIAEKGGFWKKENIIYKDELIDGVFENYNFQNMPGQMVSLFIDISDRKLAEAKLRENEARLKEAQHIAQIGSWELCLQTNKLFWSEEIYHIFEMDPSKFEGSYEAFVNAIHPDDRAMVDKAYTESITNKMPYVIDHRLLMKDGRVKFVQERCETTYDNDGSPVSSIGTVQDISSRKALEQKAQQWQQVFDKAEFGLALVDIADRTFVDVNNAFAHCRGYSPEELRGQPFLEIYPPKEREKIQKQLGSIDASGHELFESVHQRKDGSRFPVLVETTTIKDEKGRPVSRVGFSVDITEQKKSEEKLRKSEARLRRFYESGLLGVIYWNMDGEITSANERFLEMTGYNREELETGQIDWVHMTPPEFRHLDEKAIIELKTKGVNKKSFEKEYIRKDGSRISIELAGAMLDEKRFDGVAFVLDISERKLVEMELIQAATQWQTTFDASNDAIWILDEAHHILRTNKKAGRLFQIPNEGLGSKNCCQIIHGSEIQIPECPLLRSKVSLKRESLVLPLGEKWFAATVDPILDENGQYAGAVHTLSDITEHRNMEAQLHQSQKMDSIGRLAGGVAHDFNNMLSIINGYSDIALERLNPSDPLYEDIHEIKDAGRRSADLTRQLLGFARKQIVKPEIVDLNIPINQSVKMIQRLVSEDVTIELIQAPDIWLVNIDSSQLDQILVNLAVNSRDAIDGVGNIIIETANITLDADYCSEHLGFSEGQFVTLTFTDTGRGMDKETQQKMFEPFFTTKDEGKGTGLGLSTLYGIVKQNNGFINVYSELDQGTAFKIYLPRVDEVEEKPESNPVDVQSLTGSETILVVEDEKQILRLCQRILEINGYKVITADKPGEAIVLCEKFPGEIHFLITDVVMPSMNGKELHERIKRIKPNIKALYMSGYTANVIAHRGVLTEGVRFIQKPFSPKALVQKVREILDATKERTHD